MDASQQPLSLAWEIFGGDTVSDSTNGLAGIKSGQKILNDNTVFKKDDPCIPVVIAAYSSHLEVTAGRNIQLFS